MIKINNLKYEGKTSLFDLTSNQQESFVSYLKTRAAYWYWSTLILSTMITITIFIIPETHSLVPIRYVLGLILTMWLPGYSLIKGLFPSYKETFKKTIDELERGALSIGTSLALLSVIGLILNYTPWGIQLISVIFSLFMLTTIFATIGIRRQHLSAKRYSQNR